ncbi:Oxoglutarate/iron-dependent dioxygenase [Phaffia rhodozyma]|uniref:Oxoglutarate/iron-dependent dioxygenase n=1 Tax=Phaffia rhodozyma TaxID=264483 RepID=A0A0F7ST65_PHARH|nr:Oxoglutarate/iron-dependent dioxygenase [Phaffia rhodozyma]
MDTELLLMILCSLLPPSQEFSPEDLLRALVDHEGDPQLAARHLSNLADDRSIGKHEQKSKSQPTSVAQWLAPQQSSSSSASAVSESKRSRADSPPVPSKRAALPPQLSSVIHPDLSIRFSPNSNINPTAPSSNSNSSLPLLTLATDHLRRKHLPAIVVPPSPLSSNLASALFLQLIEDSKTWKQLAYWIGSREVQSPHTTSFYVSSKNPPPYTPSALTETAKNCRYHSSCSCDIYPIHQRLSDCLLSPRSISTGHNMSSDTPPPPQFPALLQEAADLLEPIVNASIQSRARYEGEWMGTWKAGVAACNRYEGGEEGVGPHADQLTYLGPYPTIASLSLGTPRKFRLRAVSSKDPAIADQQADPRTYDIPLGHNTFLIMHPPVQEGYKHSIPRQRTVDIYKPSYDVHRQWIPPEERKAYKARIAVTFRFYRADFAPHPSSSSVSSSLDGPPGINHQGTPLCYCKSPCVLKADQRGRVSTNRRIVPSSSSSSMTTSFNPSSHPTPPTNVNPTHSSPPTPAPYVFFWMCNKKSGSGGVDEKPEGKGPSVVVTTSNSGQSITKNEGGCSFFRILDLAKEGRDCGRSSLSLPVA